MSYSIAPSLYELMVGNHMNRDFYGITKYNFRNALFIANPEFPIDSSWSFPDLPGTIKEVESITIDIDSSAFTYLKGAKATYQKVVQHICEFDLLYFATHGISDVANSLDNSFLVLAKEKNKYFLSARDIQGIRDTCRLSADLVILSACQTGLGQEHEGGMIGLPRAFQIAGANHILMSLWNIHDEETAIFMSLFFDHLKKGGYFMPHEALRNAILKYKQTRNNDPYYWAAFSIFGSPY